MRRERLVGGLSGLLYLYTNGGKDLVAALSVLDPRSDGLGAYFDESHRDGLYLVSGVLFYPTRAQRFRARWLTQFPDGFHAAKFNVGVPSDEDHKKLAAGAKVIGECVAYSSCVMCSTTDALKAFKSEKNAQAKAYLSCCGLAALGLSEWLRKMGRKESVAYFHDRPVPGEAADSLNDLFEKIRASGRGRSSFRYSSHTVASATTNVWLQAADFLAWEYGRERLAKESGGPTRPYLEIFRRAAQSKMHVDLVPHVVSGKQEMEHLESFSNWLNGGMPYHEEPAVPRRVVRVARRRR